MLQRRARGVLANFSLGHDRARDRLDLVAARPDRDRQVLRMQTHMPGLDARGCQSFQRGKVLNQSDSGHDLGQALGVVGPTGCGRSTLIKLMLGLYRPTSGSISIDGVNLAQLHRVELRSAIAYTPSDPQFFYGTLAQNMRLAAPLATDEQIEAILTECGVDLRAAPFHDGLSTRLSAGGYAALPATVRHRIALARALVKESPIVIVDSPSALAGAGEEELLPQVIEKRKGRTTFIVASNCKSVLERCDLIMAMNDGRMAGVKPVEEVFAQPQPRSA